MRAYPAVPTDNHAAADNCARADPTASAYLCSGLDHSERPNLRRRVDARPLCNNCGRMDTGRRGWQRIEQCSNARPPCVRFDCLDRHGRSRDSRCHLRMHDHRAGRRVVERRCITSIVQEANFVRAGRLQRGHSFEEQFEFNCNPAGGTRNHCKRVWSTPAKKPRAPHRSINHIVVTLPANGSAGTVVDWLSENLLAEAASTSCPPYAV